MLSFHGTDAGAFLRFAATYEAAGEAAEDALIGATEQRLGKKKESE